MVRLSCFAVHNHHHKSKKAVRHLREVSPEEMPKELREYSQKSGRRVSPHSYCSNSKTDDGAPSNFTQEPLATACTDECCWRSEDLDGNSYNGDDKEGQAMLLKKSHSLGSGLDRGNFLCDMEENDNGGKIASINPDESDPDKISDSVKSCTSSGFHVNHLGNECTDQAYGNSDVPSLDVNADPISRSSLFSIGDTQQFDEDLHIDNYEQLCAGPLEMPGLVPAIRKARSLPMLDINVANNGGDIPSSEYIQRSKSFEDFLTAGTYTQDSHYGREFEYNTSGAWVGASSHPHNIIMTELSLKEKSLQSEVYTGGNGRSNEIMVQVGSPVHNEGKTDNSDTFCNHMYDSNNHSSIVDHASSDHESHGGVEKFNAQKEATFQGCSELSGQEFNVRRIEQWLSHIDFHSNDPIEENPETSVPVSETEDTPAVSGASLAKGNLSSSPSTEAAYNYMSSLTATSSSAQMANLGLVVIPFLSAFTSLRMLNLSGNSIVRIIAGALPRGLHTLNLSRNNISTIEGLRELGRLRILDLSFNRILRIGHGLSACTSLKELYLAGNKISEVEGLHRLLKLTILDLRYNKISTAKCLGQLAANYGSLQAINLEGNPAQRNVGDEQLKRYLLNLLPHLVYFNKQTIKANSSKDVSERFSRSATSHQPDRGIRDQKRSRRGHHSGSYRLGSIAGDGKPGQTSNSSPLKHSRARHAPLPPLGSRPSNNYLPSLGSKFLGSHSSNPIRRSRSEGNL